MKRRTCNLFLLTVFLLAGCSAPEPKLRIVWPPPPDEPRLEFIGVYGSEDDFPKTEAQKMVEKLVGKPPLSAFKSPFGIAADGKGIVYVSDIHAHNVRVYDFNKYTVHYLTKSPVFDAPFDLDIDSAGRLYIADGDKKQVMVYATGGEEPTPLFSFGDEKLFTRPSYLNVNERLGRIYVSDGGGAKVVVFDLQGKHLFSFGSIGDQDGQFFGPQGIAIDGQDRVFVADQFNTRVQVFDADGKFLYKFGERGDQVYQFESPKDLAFDSDGNLYVIDGRRPHILTYTPDGTLLLATGGDTRTSHPLGYSTPRSIFIDGNDRIYVADMTNKRFSVWQYLSKSYLEEHPITEEDRKRLQEALDKAAAKKK